MNRPSKVRHREVLYRKSFQGREQEEGDAKLKQAMALPRQ
jgi:hypothetical protein